MQFAEDIADAIPTAGFFALDPEDHTGEYALTPLNLAPTPDAMAAALFAPELLDAHLDHLVSEATRGRWLAGDMGAAERWRAARMARPV